MPTPEGEVEIYFMWAGTLSQDIGHLGAINYKHLY